MQTWKPTLMGRLLTSSPPWTITLNDQNVVVIVAGTRLALHLRDIRTVDTPPDLLWSRIELAGQYSGPQLRGIRRLDSLHLANAITRARAEWIETVTSTFPTRVSEVIAWADAIHSEAADWHGQHRWIPRRVADRWEVERPNRDFDEMLRLHELQETVATQPRAFARALELWNTAIHEAVSRWNDEFLEWETNDAQEFFATVERSPLTEEQIRAVVCFDDRVQVVASAGSGKTSTMVAKAGYALHRQIHPADRILMLAFNAKAASELRERVSERLESKGLDASRIVASTFHAFGLQVIGRATGRKPSLAPWLADGQDIEHLMRIVDRLRDDEVGFRRDWDLFRLVYGKELPSFGEPEEPEDWDPNKRRGGFRTLQGEVVKSNEELWIANWLFYNGVEYEYERPYEIDTTDADHRQYTPDFYYPAGNMYHEHFALDRDGRAPAHFVGYEEGVAWKRQVHATNATTLLETLSATVHDGTAFKYLAEALSELGIHLDPNPDRPVIGREVLEHDQLIRTVRAFMIHAKSNRLKLEELSERAGRLSKNPLRSEVFLRLFARIAQEWDDELRNAGYIDFEDMLTQAADHLEAGEWLSPFELVMVDEMQDASFARARLVRALTAEQGTTLFAVGDDWQSINRFAGSDLSVMTEFQEWFGPGELMKLERTFRSPQSICNVSSAFVSKNPRQLSKRVVSAQPEESPTIRALALSSDRHFAGAISDHLDHISRRSPARGTKTTVFVLGRYRKNSMYAPAASRWPNLDIQFHTVHASKGLEADHVIIPGLVSGAFPSSVADDPVLTLAMPAPEDFPHAEERRLFYVALTRARMTVLLLTVVNRVSPFMVELARDGLIRIENAFGEEIEDVPCPKCGQGVMVERHGRYGTFLGCSRFPKCDGKAKVPSRVSG